MMAFIKVAHLLSLGLWVGGVAFFSFFTALPIIARMKALATTPGNWARLVDEKQGIRMAGEALDAVFARYFPFQVTCGVIALVTTLVWLTSPGLVHKARAGIVAAALALATLNWLVFAPKVHELRLQRYSDNAELAVSADAQFGPAHQQSLYTDMGTLVLVAVALALAAWMPVTPPAANPS
jgi:hypothetical protein